jgi:peptide/nickel transport system permease protein
MEARDTIGTIPRPAPSPLERIFAVFRSTNSALRGSPKLSLFFLSICIVIAILPVSWITPYDSIEISPADLLRAPEFSGHLLGTDNQGRDVLSRLIHGGQSSVRVAVAAVMLAGLLGTLIALVAGVLRGWVDRVLMQITDAFLSLPYLMVALTVVTLLGPSIINLIIVIGFLRWMGFARVLRGEVLRLMEMDFVRLANVAGSSRPRIMLRHVFPNIINTLLVLATLEVGLAVIVEASLSFLGLGVQRPIPSWGNMLRDAQQFLFFPGAWWFPLIPGIAITFLVMSCNLTGDWLRDRTDPTRRQL